MSLYNMVHGFNPLSLELMGVLGIDYKTVERFRDACISKYKGEFVIRIFCRTGGPNRAHHKNTVLVDHSLYLADEDDQFDDTYAYYYFKLPGDLMRQIAIDGVDLASVADTMTLKEKLDALKL